VIVVFAVPLLDKIRVDDVVGAMPVHLLAGISGTLAVPLANIDATLLAQILGIGAFGAFVSAISLVVWLVLRFTIGLRPSLGQEMDGMDQTEIGLEAYPEFGGRQPADLVSGGPRRCPFRPASRPEPLWAPGIFGPKKLRARPIKLSCTSLVQIDHIADFLGAADPCVATLCAER